ncbi:MAG: hypothetical protein ACOYME_03900, partial [Prochlorotrichaceae cyanobacterium]
VGAAPPRPHKKPSHFILFPFLMMLGFYQHSHVRLSVNASRQQIRDSLTCSDQIQAWMMPQVWEPDFPPALTSGMIYKSQWGFITIAHEVTDLNDRCLKLLLSEGIEGFHYWHWDDRWLDSRLEGVSLLPIALIHTYALFRLRSFLG